MIHDYTRNELLQLPRLHDSMHIDRKKVFVDTLRWDVPVVGDFEIDRFDNEQAMYLIDANAAGQHQTSVRLLETERPHLLSEVFAELVEGDIPRGPGIREITRYLACPDIAASGRRVARNKICRALIEYGLAKNLTGYTAVCEIGFLAQMLSAGWRIDPLGLPKQIAGCLVGAFFLHVEPEAIAKMVRSWHYPTTAYFPRFAPLRIAA
jgi:N-acyl-L-homoserine lactone synthetase